MERLRTLDRDIVGGLGDGPDEVDSEDENDYEYGFDDDDAAFIGRMRELGLSRSNEPGQVCLPDLDETTAPRAGGSGSNRTDPDTESDAKIARLLQLQGYEDDVRE